MPQYFRFQLCITCFTYLFLTHCHLICNQSVFQRGLDKPLQTVSMCDDNIFELERTDSSYRKFNHRRVFKFRLLKHYSKFGLWQIIFHRLVVTNNILGQGVKQGHHGSIRGYRRMCIYIYIYIYSLQFNFTNSAVVEIYAAYYVSVTCDFPLGFYPETSRYTKPVAFTTELQKQWHYDNKMLGPLTKLSKFLYIHYHTLLWMERVIFWKCQHFNTLSVWKMLALK